MKSDKLNASLEAKKAARKAKEEAAKRAEELRKKLEKERKERNRQAAEPLLRDTCNLLKALTQVNTVIDINRRNKKDWNRLVEN